MFSFWVLNTRALDVITCALFCIYRICSKCKERAHKVSVYVAMRSSHSAYLRFSLLSSCFFGFFPGGEEGWILLANDQKRKALVSVQKYDELCKELGSHFQNTSPGKNPAIKVVSIRYRDLRPLPKPHSPLSFANLKLSQRNAEKITLSKATPIVYAKIRLI